MEKYKLKVLALKRNLWLVSWSIWGLHAFLALWTHHPHPYVCGHTAPSSSISNSFCLSLKRMYIQINQDKLFFSKALDISFAMLM